jgi:hypothetical protein
VACILEHAVTRLQFQRKRHVHGRVHMTGSSMVIS